MGNYSFKTTGLPEPVNGVVKGHNFWQGVPHTSIYSGYSGLTFIDCNLTNCDIPVDSITDGCCLGNVSFCSHLHPKWLDKNYISECIENCSHVTNYDTISIDGEQINTNYSYADKAV